MARKLKTFVTTLGFFEQAIAAPSMKAALEAWDVRQNLFQKGLAAETDNPEIIAVAMADPGAVLKRAVGSKAKFQKNAKLPESLPAGPAAAAPARSTPKETVTKSRPTPPTDTSTQKSQAQNLAYEQARAKRELERAKAEKRRAADEAKDVERHRKADARSRKALVEAEERHDETISKLNREWNAIEQKIDAENKRWAAKKRKLAGQ